MIAVCEGGEQGVLQARDSGSQVALLVRCGAQVAVLWTDVEVLGGCCGARGVGGLGLAGVF